MMRKSHDGDFVHLINSVPQTFEVGVGKNENGAKALREREK